MQRASIDDYGSAVRREDIIHMHKEGGAQQLYLADNNDSSR